MADGSERIFLEVGPGGTLSTFARGSARGIPGCESVASLPQAKDPQSDLSFILNTVAKLWLSGVPIDWVKLHEGERLQRVPLPSYPFERQRYCIQPQLASRSQTLQAKTQTRNHIDDWFYVPSWTRSLPPSSVLLPENRSPWLIFKDQSGLADQVAKTLLSRGEPFVTVEPGKEFVRQGENTFSINPDRPEDYVRLLRELQATGIAPRSTLYLWGLPTAMPGGCRATFHSMLRFAQALGERRNRGLHDWIVVSAGMQNVTGREAIDPMQALLLGPVKVIPCENSDVICRVIDLPQPDPWHDGLDWIAQNLLLEPAMPKTSQVVAYRDGHRWQQSYVATRLPGRENTVLRERGVYLITGGTGGIGLTLAAHLAEKFKARLALTCRTSLPPRAEWKQWIETHNERNRTSDVLKAIEGLESLGAEVLILTADVSDRAAMSRCVGEIHDRFGRINGVIHAAGVAIGGVVQLKTKDSAEKVLSPKVDGTIVLDSLLADDPLDFLILCSSVSAIIGVAGAVDYCSANAFLDAFAASRHGRCIVASLNWDAWQEVGMAANTVVPVDMMQAWKKSLLAGITQAEGVVAFRRVLDAGVSQVAIITRDLPSILEQAEKQAESVPSETQSDPGGQMKSGDAVHPRPGLQVEYIEPVGDTQKQIAAIWEQLLGIDRVGIDDNFFELGGHSLLATRVLSRVRNAFGLSIPLRAIFEAPTIHSLANHVDTLLWATSKPPASESDMREELEL